MYKTYSNYIDARKVALDAAHRLNTPIALRLVREYGKLVYVVSIYCVNDSNRCEVIKPTDQI